MVRQVDLAALKYRTLSLTQKSKYSPHLNQIWTNFDPKLTHFTGLIGLVSAHPSQPRDSKGCRVLVESEGTYGKATYHAQICVKHHWRSKPREKNDLDKPKFEPILIQS